MNELASKPPTRPADPLSILSLSAGIASLLLAVFSVLPLVGMCLMPVSALCMLTGLVSGVVSLVRTTANRELDGRLQALAGVFFSLLWCGVAALLFLIVFTKH